MARDTTEVQIGTGYLYWAAEGTTFPANPTTTPGSAWTDIGYSDAGWSFNVTRATADIEVAESLDPLDVMATSREIHLVGAAVQVSPDNLRLAFGGGTISTGTPSAGFTTYTPPATDAVTKFAFLLRVTLGSGKTRDIQMPHGMPIGAVELHAQKAPNKSMINMDARIVKVTPDEIFTIIDEV